MTKTKSKFPREHHVVWIGENRTHKLKRSTKHALPWKVYRWRVIGRISIKSDVPSDSELTQTSLETAALLARWCHFVENQFVENLLCADWSNLDAVKRENEHQSINESINQSINQSLDQSTGKWTSINQWINQSLGHQKPVMVNYACAFSQSKSGKYFEWIIT